MDDIKKKLTQNEEIFFNNLSLYIDKEVYFYGSIQRPDYVNGKSDIDVDIFTDNESSTIQKLCNFLNVKRSIFTKIVYKINNTMINGYKMKYKDEIKKINIEISVYNEKYKNIVLYDHKNYSYLPFYTIIVLIILKFLYYTLGIIPKDLYKKFKQFLINPSSELRFIAVDN
jgi:hypothetical protein